MTKEQKRKNETKVTTSSWDYGNAVLGWKKYISILPFVVVSQRLSDCWCHVILIRKELSGQWECAFYWRAGKLQDVKAQRSV